MAANGDRTYHNTESQYSLPNDASEHERLNLQSRAIDRMLFDKTIHAPLTNPKRILEVGCGTGIMTRHFAQTYPLAEEIIGVDLSPVPDPANATPTKAKFIQGDFRKLATDPELYLGSRTGSFDYIFSRMLVYGMPSWPNYISQAHTLLRAGGWLELQELQTDALYNSHGHLLSASWPWLQEMGETWAKRGLDMSCGPKLEGYLRDAGFVDVRVRVYCWMMDSREGHPETEMIASFTNAYTAAANFGAYRKVLGAGKSEGELLEVENQMQTAYAREGVGKHMRFYVVWGRKAEG